jgi:hypothetical protein
MYLATICIPQTFNALPNVVTLINKVTNIPIMILFLLNCSQFCAPDIIALLYLQHNSILSSIRITGLWDFVHRPVVYKLENMTLRKLGVSFLLCGEEDLLFGSLTKSKPHSVHNPPQSQCQSHVKTGGQSISTSWCQVLELVTRYYFLSERCCVVSLGRRL